MLHRIPHRTIRYLAIPLLFITSCLKLQAQDNTKNYVLTRTFKEAKTDAALPVSSKDALIELQYLDELGRPRQTVAVQAGKSAIDLVTPVEYDPIGRPYKTYLPAPTAATDNSGAFRSNATELAQTYYNNDRFADKTDRAFSETIYEASPLDRVKSTIQPGTTAAVTYNYGLNAADEVKKYKAGSDISDITQDGAYAANQLTYTKTTDESGKTVTDYKDKDGLTVLKIVGTDAYTYYVYNDLQQLRAVLQPQLQASFTTTTLQQFAFLYHYNDRGLLDQKHVPATQGVYSYVYNGRDLLTRVTDPNGYSVNTDYDALNRPTRTYNAAGTNLSYTYYDGYDNTSPSGDQLRTKLAYEASQVSWPGSVPADVYVLRKDQQTASCVQLISANGAPSNTWKCSATYYDDRYRPIQIVRQMAVSSSALERISYRLTFDGRVEREKTVHEWSGDVSVIDKAYTFDQANRPTSVQIKTSGRSLPSREIYANVQTYSEVGQPVTKFLHAANEQGAGATSTLTYKYDVRGWLRSLSAPAPNFSLGLNYENNGNINTMSWQHPGSSGSYQFAYDALNRLTSGRSGPNGSGTGEVVRYSLNGNIDTLWRYEGSTQVDNLVYSYEGNRLKKVTDGANNPAGFNNGNSGGNDDYTHDANGNTLTDGNRSASVAYNYLNLPRQVTINGKTLSYVYESRGIKRSFSNGSSPTSYEGIFEYDGGNNVTRVATEEGQLVKVNGVWQWQYYLKDHLGNVRVVFEESGTVVQQSEYQPFGLALLKSGNVSDNKYLYNGKEAQQETNWLDYGARMYDPAIGRWQSVDPMSDFYVQHSAYAYTLNNPLRFTDPTGMAVEDMGDAVRYTGKDMLNLYNTLVGRESGDGDPKKKEGRNPSFVPITSVAVRKGAESVVGRLMGFVALFLSPHQAGVRNEWEQHLPDHEESRYEELLGKRSSATATGGQLSLVELRELIELENRKFPWGHGKFSAQGIEIWNLGDGVITKSHHNWSKIFGNNPYTLSDVESILQLAVKNGSWQTTGIIHGKGGKILGDKLELIHNVNGHNIWVGAMKEHSTGLIIINNGAVQ